MPELTHQLRITDIRAKKERGEKIAMLTAYDATMARLMQRAGIEILLVGDSLGMVIMGEDNTIPVTMDIMVHHTRAVVRGAPKTVVVADMPFGSYQASVEDAVRNATRCLREGGAAAVKLEGGAPMLETVERLVQVGIPVMGHLGLTPQSVHQLGGFRKQGKDEEAAEQMIADAAGLEKAGAFSIVLESIPPELAQRITREVSIPTIGIGAGPHCDGQVLVCYDVFGLFDEFVPYFVKQYAQMGAQMVSATEAFAEDVRKGRFPEAK